ELEGVERRLERLAANEPAARLARLAGGDRALAAEPAELQRPGLPGGHDLDPGVALRRAPDRDVRDRDLVRPARHGRRAGDDGDELRALLVQVVLTRDVVGDLRGH